LDQGRIQFFIPIGAVPFWILPIFEFIIPDVIRGLLHFYMVKIALNTACWLFKIWQGFYLNKKMDTT
jgi:hypothetical protein